jgi:hypothetical protein
MDDYSIRPLFAVMLNLNSAEDTAASVESLLAADAPEMKIVVVDNGSTDDSAAVLRARFSGQIELLVSGCNLGFAGGINLGLRHALKCGAAAVLVMNNDTLVDPAMIRYLSSAAMEHPEAGIFAPAIYDHARRERLWRLGDRRHRWLPFPLQIPYHEAARVLVPADYVTGCAMLIRRDVLERVGLFDEDYFFYFEDADFCGRARRAGYVIYVAPQARMWHKAAATARRVKPLVRFHRARGQVMFYRAHPQGFSRLLTGLYVIAKTLLQAGRDALAGDFTLAAASVRGALDGYRHGRP